MANRLKNSKGNSLVLIMMMVAAISTIAMATASALWRDKNRLNSNYLNMLARYAADSGIELAKNDIFTGTHLKRPLGLSKRKLTFFYESDHFTRITGKDLTCEVSAWIHPDKIFFDSRARIYNRTGSQVKGRMIAEKTIKHSILIKKHPLKILSRRTISN